MHVGEVIHQEAFFKAKQQRVYTALTDTEQFDKVTQFSEAMKRGLPPGSFHENQPRCRWPVFVVWGLRRGEKRRARTQRADRPGLAHNQLDSRNLFDCKVRVV